MAERRPAQALPLALLLCLVPAALPGAARAEDRAEGAVLLYTDDDAVTVVTTTTRASVDAGPATFGAQVGVDVISAASVDLVSAASPAGFEETRQELEGSAAFALPDTLGLTAGYGYSTEPDFVSHRFALGGSRELLDRRVTLGFGLGTARAEVGRSGDSSFSRVKDTRSGEASASFVLAPRWALDLSGSMALVTGYQASPYRFVRLYAEGAAEPSTAVPEQVPARRVRGTSGARVRARLAPQLFTRAGYEYYADSWGIAAHALEAKVSQGLFDELVFVSLSGRGYVQGGADFYRERYSTFPEAPELRTAELKLGPLWSALGGARVEVSPPIGFCEALRIGLGFELYHLRFEESALLESRTARLLTADLYVGF